MCGSDMFPWMCENPRSRGQGWEWNWPVAFWVMPVAPGGQRRRQCGQEEVGKLERLSPQPWLEARPGPTVHPGVAERMCGGGSLESRGVDSVLMALLFPVVLQQGTVAPRVVRTEALSSPTPAGPVALIAASVACGKVCPLWIPMGPLVGARPARHHQMAFACRDLSHPFPGRQSGRWPQQASITGPVWCPQAGTPTFCRGDPGVSCPAC